MSDPSLDRPRHRLSVGDLRRILDELDGGWPALSQLASSRPEWSVLINRLLASEHSPLTLSENSTEAPVRLLDELLANFERHAYFKDGPDPMVWDSPRREFDEQISLQEVYRRFGSDVLYRLLEAGGYYAKPA